MAAPASEKPTLRALLARRDLDLRLTTDEAELPAGALDRALRWVHGSDLADPTPFLSEELALLTTGTQFPADDESPAYEAYVARLSARGVLGLGFGTEIVRQGVPTGLAAACRTHGIPLFEVPYRTPFIAVARANAESVAAEAYARRSWALAAQRALALAALRPDGLGATLAELARQLGTWVGLFDAAGALAREHPVAFLGAEDSGALHAEVDAVLRRGARAGSSLRIGETPFTLQTLGRGGHLRGVLAIAAGDLDQEGRGVITAVVAMAGLALEQRQGFERSRSQFRSALISSLVLDEPAFARRMARELFGGLPVAPIVIAVTDAAASRSHAVMEWLELRADERNGGLFFGRGDGGLVLVAAEGHDDLLTEFAEHFGEHLGVSAPTTYEQFARAVEQARVARDRGVEPLTRFADLAGSGVLALLETPDARTVAAAALDPLVRYDADNGTELVATLRAWLDADCSLEACARALGIHRHTARARIALVERVLGCDLTSFSARAELWAAMVALS